MFAHLIRQGTHPRTAALKVGTRLRRLAAALAAVTIGLLASAATIPAAFASDVPRPGSGYELGRFGPVPATTSHAAATGMPGWQIILIAVGAVLVAAAVTIVLARARAGQRPSHRQPPDPRRPARAATSREPGPSYMPGAGPGQRPGPRTHLRAVRYQAEPHDGSSRQPRSQRLSRQEKTMFIHPSISRELARERQREMLAQARRQRLARRFHAESGTAQHREQPWQRLHRALRAAAGLRAAPQM